MEPLTAAILGSALIGGIMGERQGAANRRAMEAQAREQARRDKINMMAAAYGINAHMSPAPAQYRGGETMQGALAGAQFALMNPSLWSSKEKAIIPTNTVQPLVYNQSAYGNYYPVDGRMINMWEA